MAHVAFLGFALLAAFAAPQAGQYAAELKHLVAADQADRQFSGTPTKAQLKQMSQRDAVRFRRVKQILSVATEFNADEFDAAALLFQHADKPEDYITAHELAACADALGKISSLAALAEDRFLVSIHRRQRFGSQFDWHGKQAEIDEQQPAAVTDDLRLDFLIPALSEYRDHGYMAGQFASNAISKRFLARRDADHPLFGDPVISPKLVEMTPSFGARAVVLDFYQAGKIVTDADLSNAARILLSSNRPEELLLAHEFASLAMGELYSPARPLFAETWDAFATSIGRPTRYAPHRPCRAVQLVLDPTLATAGRL